MKEVLNKMCVDINVQINNHAGFVGQILVNELKSNESFNLSDAEMMLREMNSRVYLIALPIKFYGEQYSAFYPGKEGDLPYALWVCMNGKEEAEATMNKHELSGIDNMVQLMNCGFLTMKQNG